MNLHMPPELQTLQGKVRRLVDNELIPLEVETEMRSGNLAPGKRAELSAKAIEYGLNAPSLPKEVGGQGLSMLGQVIVNEELGKATNGLWDVVFDPAVCLTAATPEQVERYGRPSCQGWRRDCYAIIEPGASSDPSVLETKAVRDGDNWVINGEKWRVADRAVQIFGGRGYMRENVAERFYRELRVDRIWEGTSEIQRIIIANSLYRRGLTRLIEA